MPQEAWATDQVCCEVGAHSGPSRSKQDSLLTCSDALGAALTGPLELMVKCLGIC